MVVGRRGSLHFPLIALFPFALHFWSRKESPPSIHALWKETDKCPLLIALTDLYEGLWRDGTAQTKTNNCASQLEC